MTAQTTTTPAGEKKEGEPQEPKMVLESDLLAVKSAKEGLQQKLTEFESKFSTTQEKLNVAEAKVQTLEARLSQAITPDTHDKVKKELEAAQEAVKSLGTKTLEARKALIANTYKVHADVLAKYATIETLDLFEDALKATVGSRGTGNYAAGGGSGGAGQLEGKTPYELAKSAYETSNK